MSDTARPALSVVAPCFNEEGMLPEFLQRVGVVLEGLGGTAEIVLVDDGWRESRWGEMPDLAPEDRGSGPVPVYGKRRPQRGQPAGLHDARADSRLTSTDTLE